jgi:hypothetical protein
MLSIRFVYGINTSYGINANAVPARASNYTTGDPAQTSASVFQTGNSEAFDSQRYWSSTESAASSAFRQYFLVGDQFDYIKDGSNRVRAIRRVAV